MRNKGNFKNTKRHIFSWCFFTLLLCGIFFSFSFASDFNAKIYEAAYLFEMKGEYAQAIEILETVSKNGNEKEQASADFLLGKIQELKSNASMADFYYKQGLKKEDNASKAYWIAERMASVNPYPEKIFEKSLKLRYPIREIYVTDSVRLLLENRTIYNPTEAKYSKLPLEIPDLAHVESISENGFWWQYESILHFTPKKRIIPAIDLPIEKSLTSFKILSPFTVAYLDGSVLVHLSGTTVKFRTEPKYRDCELQGSFVNTSQILLNCPDNALHIISKEDGHEIDVIPMLYPISKFYQDENGLLLFSENTLWYYSRNDFKKPLWKKPGIMLEDAKSFGNFWAILESSGKVSLLHKKTGAITLYRQTSATNILNFNTGLLGLLSTDGSMVATDTLLKPLWTFQLGRTFFMTPWVNEGVLYYPSASDSIQVLNVLHYGKKEILSKELAFEAGTLAAKGGTKTDSENVMILIDSCLALEPGNANALFLKAIALEESKTATNETKSLAWTKAIANSAGEAKLHKKILKHYAQIINAKHISQIPLSPRTLYPNFTVYKKSLITMDAASKQIIALSENGDLQWNLDIQNMEGSPVSSSLENMFAFASGFTIGLVNLDKPSKAKYMELPGKAFHIAMSEKSLFVSTWNGFLQKIRIPDFKLLWTRKLSSEPFYTHIQGSDITLVSLSGVISHVQKSSGQKKEAGPNLGVSITQILERDSLTVMLSSDQRIFAYFGKDSPVITLSPAKDILFARLVKINDKFRLLVSFADQEIRAYSLPEGEILWNYKGQKSLFGQMAVTNNSLWIDQGDYLQELSLSNGKELLKFQIQGGAGTPFTANQTLYCATPQRLLYSFNLP